MIFSGSFGFNSFVVISFTQKPKYSTESQDFDGRDVGLETWSWSRDRSRPLFWSLGLSIGLDPAGLVLVLVLASLLLVSEGGLEQDLRLCATATLLVSKVETSK